MEEKKGYSKMSRRKAIKNIGAITTASISIPNLTIGMSIGKDSSNQVRVPYNKWSGIKGFNYQPSYGSTGFELWHYFDENKILSEIKRGKELFPSMNALRWWQSWDAYLRDPERYVQNFEKTLKIADKVDCKVMPCLFNRWHSAELDYGGIYIDHFLPKVSWIQKKDMFFKYLESIVGQHKNDPRIIAWDICNEPFSYSCPIQSIPNIVDAEINWLRSLYTICKDLGTEAPVTVGIHGSTDLDVVDSFSDVLSIHPYWMHNDPNSTKEDFERKLDSWSSFALKVKKPIIATECCWGALDDNIRVESIKYTLTQLKDRNIGWMCYVLNHSLVADSHRPEFGPLGNPGNLAFIEEDGSIRPGHQIFNNF